MHELDGGGEGAVLDGLVTVLPDGYAPGFGDLGGYLGARQYAAMAWLGSLRQLDFYHFDAVLPRPIGKNLFRKISLFIATAEIARPDIPDQIAFVLKMVAADPAFACVVGEVAQQCAFVQGQHGVGRKSAEAHGRYI